MLTPGDIQSLKTALIEEQRGLVRDEATVDDERGPVMLDQQSIGRLSRMDAMQRQAMAQAASRRRASRLSRIKAALARIDEGEYGFCQDCGEDIALKRLELDPTVPLCISCAKG